ncbi:hypothetical protein S1OALGB6SA_2053 [Olavius algarvensis spirochete endosymbiont]|nr:hypothetical protein S1OALGB6SA_2053 [Olavius algarvensis spirochete endosymbiont]
MRTFAFLHELAHLILRLSGLCDLSEENTARPREFEVFCNKVAILALVADKLLLRLSSVNCS